MRFVSETLARMRRLAPDAEVTVRADAGFFSYDLLDLIEARNASWSFTIPQNAKVKAAIAAIDDKAWQSIAYTRGGQAQVAETTIKTGPRSRSAEPRELRLVVRRTRLTGPQAELWPDWRHHCLVTNRADLNTETADTYHRAHARVELAIKDLKDNGLAHCPSGKFFANGAHLACAMLAHNLTRWITRRPRPTPQTPHRRGHRPQPAPVAAGTSRQPLRPPHPAPAPQLALETHLHHSAATPTQPAPAHINARPGDRHPQHTPQRHQPNPTPTPTLHAPTHQTRRRGPLGGRGPWGRACRSRHGPVYLGR